MALRLISRFRCSEKAVEAHDIHGILSDIGNEDKRRAIESELSVTIMHIQTRRVDIAVYVRMELHNSLPSFSVTLINRRNKSKIDRLRKAAQHPFEEFVAMAA